jgi:hypothetical protein
MSTNLRKWFGIIITIICYYVVHEGSHLLVALILGVFRTVRFMALGVQIVINASDMSNLQLAVFNIAGSVGTFFAAYILVLLRNHILLSHSKPFKAACYYTTLGLLLIDPIYLSILCGFFGGGDMNGIILFGIPEVVARSIYALIGIINTFVLIKYVYPAYKQNFAKEI